MQRIDVLIIAALVVAGAGSLVGVLAYEDDRFAPFSIAWALRTEPLDVPALSHAGGGEAETTFEVDRANLTRLSLVVTVTGAAARLQPTAVRVELVSPTNESVAAEDELPAGPTASIAIPLEMELAPVPDAPTVTAPSLEAARGALDATLSSTLGVGTWTLRASFAPSAPGPLGDEAHTLAATAELEWYEAELSSPAPEVPR